MVSCSNTHSWWPLHKEGAAGGSAEDAGCISGWGSSCTSAPQYLGSRCSPEGGTGMATSGQGKNEEFRRVTAMQTKFYLDVPDELQSRGFDGGLTVYDPLYSSRPPHGLVQHLGVDAVGMLPSVHNDIPVTWGIVCVVFVADYVFSVIFIAVKSENDFILAAIMPKSLSHP